MESANDFFLSPEFLSRLDTYSNFKPHVGNYVEFFPSGAQSYKKRWEIMADAKKSLHIVSFSLMNDDTGKKLRDLLIEKLKQGVEVKMIFDGPVNNTTFSGKIIKAIEQHGGQIKQFNRLSQGWIPDMKEGHPFHQIVRNAKLKLKKHFHEKYMVVDSQYTIIGGINWGHKYAYGGIEPKAWRDSDVFISGPVVRELQCQFLRDFTRYGIWEDAVKKDRHANYNSVMRSCDYLTSDYIIQHFPTYFPELEKKGNNTVRYISHKPYDDNILNLTNSFLYAIKNAKNYLYWGCHGIRPPYILGEYLADAASRGVDVRLITNSKLSAKTLMVNGLMGWMYWECTKHYKWLLERGVKIYEWQKPGAFHSKNIIIDDTFAAVGSFNIARGSCYHHTESDVIFHGGDMPLQIKKQFPIDFQSCKEIKLNNIKFPKENAFDRPLSERDFLIHKDLLTPSVNEKLQKGFYKRILT